jgi:hypothetical protein
MTGSWLDVILWETREAAEYSAEHATEVPEAAAWFGHIHEFRGIEHLEVLRSSTCVSAIGNACSH